MGTPIFVVGVGPVAPLALYGVDLSCSFAMMSARGFLRIFCCFP